MADIEYSREKLTHVDSTIESASSMASPSHCDNEIEQQKGSIGVGTDSIEYNLSLTKASSKSVDEDLIKESHKFCYYGLGEKCLQTELVEQEIQCETPMDVDEIDEGFEVKDNDVCTFHRININTILEGDTSKHCQEQKI